jgi:hypothetical protein
MIIMDESWVSGLLFNRMLRVQLTNEELIFSVVLVKRVIVRIPLNKISNVELISGVFSEVIVTYFDRFDNFKMIDFNTSNYLQWGAAFQNLGITVRSRSVDSASKVFQQSIWMDIC